jgi:ornithine cyclodeaminase/alanine dehydrogenase-like protein (mu-crystallin family)
MTLLITQDDVEKILTPEMAIPIIEDAFRMAGEGSTENPARFRMPINKGFLQFGPAALHDKQVVGFKLWANFGSGPARGWNFLFSLETGELLAVLHSYTLGRLRTSATTAVATKYLSPPGASTIGLYGTGRLAESQIKAIAAVRPIKVVYAHSRTPKAREAFAREVSERLGIEIIPVSAPEQAAREADIVVTVTNATTPVLKGEWLVRPNLVLGIGANHWHEREIDEGVIERAKLIVVDDKEQAKVEGGDLLWPIAHGLLTWDRVEELGDIVIGRVPVPDFKTSTILFESHGLAIEDIAVSAKAYELARAKGLGREVNLSLGKARSEMLSPGVDVPALR